MKRTAMRLSLFAPQNASTTYSFLPESSFSAISLTAAQVSSDAGWLSFLYASVVHQTVFYVDGVQLGELSLVKAGQ